MPWDCLVYDNGVLVSTTPDRTLWDGAYSRAHVAGPIIKYMEECFKRYKELPILCIAPCGDGNYDISHIEEYIKKTQKADPPQRLVVCTIAQSLPTCIDGVKYLYLPIDDGFFTHGVSHFFPPASRVPWSERIPKAFWRGGCSGTGPGGPVDSYRIKTVGHLMDYPNADVKLHDWWSAGKNIPGEYFAERMTDEEYFVVKHKILLIIDGNSIASSHMWAFASGAVPMLITASICWFSEYLIPFVNYVPVAPDLSDLKVNIQWLLDHDAKAEQIANNASEFVDMIFSPSFQKYHLSKEISKICS